MAEDEHAITYSLSNQQEAVCLLQVRTGDAQTRTVALCRLITHYYRVMYSFLYNVLLSENALSPYAPTDPLNDPKYQRLTDEMHENVSVVLRDRMVAGEFAAAEVAAAQRSFGYHLYQATQRVFVEYAIACGRQDNWGKTWAISGQMTPLGPGSYLTYEDVLCDDALHFFTRESHEWQIGATSGAGGIGFIALHGATTGCLNRFSDLMEHTYQYRPGVLLLAEMKRRPLRRQVRLTLCAFFGMDYQAAVFLCPPDQAEDSTTDVRAVTATLHSDYVWLTESEAWRPMERLLRDHAGIAAPVVAPAASVAMNTMLFLRPEPPSGDTIPAPEATDGR